MAQLGKIMTPKARHEHQKRIYDQFYEPLARATITHCYYCGDTATEYDHVPPLSRLPEIPAQPLRLVPTCRTCNNSLWAYTATSILDRIKYLGNLAKHYNKTHRLKRLRDRWRNVRDTGRHQLEHFTQALERRLENEQHAAAPELMDDTDSQADK